LVGEETQRLKALGAGADTGVVPPVGHWQQSPFFAPSAASPERTRRWRIPRNRAIAAGLLLAVVAGAGLLLTRFADHGQQYTTPVGTVESVALRDGSAVTLNTGSRVRVELLPRERRIELQAGEAFFSVAKDPTRRFVVAAGNRQVVAVGTQFAVRREGADLRVIVAEGTVSLQGTGSLRLAAGSVARTHGVDLLVQKESPEAVQALLSWREGFLTFHDTTLAEAIDEFNRYNSRHIEITDPAVAAIRISGTFRPTHYEAFVRLLQEGYSIRASDHGTNITLTQN
jgi:transmembrane sensor